MKNPVSYFLALRDTTDWEAIPGSDGNMRELTLSVDPVTGDYTRLTWFRAGTDTETFGPKVHPYPEEIFVVSGRLYDAAFSQWLAPGTYASRPPGELHGPFRAESDVIILEVSYPGQAQKENS